MKTKEETEMSQKENTMKCAECGKEIKITREQAEEIGGPEILEAAGWHFEDDGWHCKACD